MGELHFDKNIENAKHVLYTNKNFIIKYNGNQVTSLTLCISVLSLSFVDLLLPVLNSSWIVILQIIHVNLTQDSAKPVEEGKVYDMTYTVKWIPTNVTFAKRFDVYLDYPFFEHQVCVPHSTEVSLFFLVFTMKKKS